MKKMSKLNIGFKMVLYLIVLILGATIGYLSDGDFVIVFLLCGATAFMISIIEEDINTR